MKTAVSFAIAFFLGVLIVAPPIDYSIPLMVNTFHWCWLAVVSGLLGIFLLQTSINAPLKALSVFLFISCFFSQAPYLSFNAYILVVFSLFLLLAFRYCDDEPIFKFVEAAFWLEFILTIMQIFGRDKLLNFDRPEPVFLGTVMQYMRFASVLAIMTPILFIRDRLYIVPILALCVLSKSSSFAISVAVMLMVYWMLRVKKHRLAIILFGLAFVVCYLAYDWGSFRGAVIASNGGRLISWLSILVTWCIDTSKATAAPFLYGSFRPDWLFFGHGMDTFLPLFPIYKHDMNPFPQAHNSWLQFLWEIGLVGFSLIVGYCANLIQRLYRTGRFELIAGLSCIGANMFFCFPDRMTQTMFLILFFIAYCEKESFRRVCR